MSTTQEKVVRVKPETHDRLQELADQDHRTLGGEADWLIEQAFLDRQQDSNPTQGGVNDKKEL